MIRTLIADDHDILREGLKQILSECADIVVKDEARDGGETLSKLQQHEYDLVLLDMAMPGISGIALIKQIKKDYPKIPILILSMYKEDLYAIRAFKAGASGYLCKDNASTQLIQAIRKVVTGGMSIGPAVAASLAWTHTGNREEPQHSRLSEREFQILQMIAGGSSVTRIAAALGLNVKTVSTYKTRIMQKMEFANISELIRYAVKHGLVIDESRVPD